MMEQSNGVSQAKARKWRVPNPCDARQHEECEDMLQTVQFLRTMLVGL